MPRTETTVDEGPRCMAGAQQGEKIRTLFGRVERLEEMYQRIDDKYDKMVRMLFGISAGLIVNLALLIVQMLRSGGK